LKYGGYDGDGGGGGGGGGGGDDQLWVQKQKEFLGKFKYLVNSQTRHSTFRLLYINPLTHTYLEPDIWYTFYLSHVYTKEVPIQENVTAGNKFSLPVNFKSNCYRN
jgi:hypothetical protein